MHASKVTINPELLKHKKLSRAKKKALREKLIKELILSKPYGTPIQLREFARVCQYNTEGEALPLIKEMEKLGEITRERTKQGRIYSYTVNGQVRTTVKKPDLTLEYLAKDFLWEHDNDSVREFVSWVTSKGYNISITKEGK